MRLIPRELLLTAIVITGGVSGMMPVAWAQGPPQTSETLKSESTGPQDPRSTGSVSRSNEPLSEKLNRTDGVIRPPANIAPDMTVRPPVPNPGTTPVIPPPGTPGGDQSIEPKRRQSREQLGVTMLLASDAAPLDQIIELAHEIIDECPSCAGTASEIVMWANEIRERRPSREELTVLVDATCLGLPDDQRTLLINGLRAFVRFAES